MNAPLPTERQVQRAVLKMMAVCFPNVVAHHSPNGAHLAGSPGARFKQIGALKGDGTVMGWPDLTCLWARGQRGCLFEIKRPKGGVVSDAQKACHERLERAGWPVTIITSPDEAYAYLKAAGAPWSGVVWA